LFDSWLNILSVALVIATIATSFSCHVVALLIPSTADTMAIDAAKARNAGLSLIPATDDASYDTEDDTILISEAVCLSAIGLRGSMF